MNKLITSIVLFALIVGALFLLTDCRPKSRNNSEIIESHLKGKINLSKDYINNYYENYIKSKFFSEKKENDLKIKFTQSMNRIIAI